MIRQSFKDVYFYANRWLVLPNSWLIRVTHRKLRNLAIHLGCGDDYRDGMINVDGNLLRRKDLWLDLRNRLPFANRSAKLIYCCHMLEHLYPHDAIQLLSEMRRVLADDGVVRLAVPSFERCLEIAAGHHKSKWPRPFDAPLSQAINYIFCDGQHKYAYCFENLSAMALGAGFGHVYHYSCDHGVESKSYGGCTLGGEPRGSLVVELTMSTAKVSVTDDCGESKAAFLESDHRRVEVN